MLSSAVFYNFDYGFIEGTRAGDGDHTDALLIIDEPTFTGCHVWARPIGGLEMRDEKGFDFKVLCVALGDAHQQHIERLEQVRPHRLVEIEHFFQTYKALEDKTSTSSAGARGTGARGPPGRPPGLGARDRRHAWVTEPGRRPRYPGEGVPGRRLFVAVPIPDDAVREIAAIVERVRAAGRPGRWPGRPLGASRWAAPDAPLPRPDAGRAGRRRHRRGRGRGRGSRPVRRSGSAAAGTFPPHGRPRALWLGVTEGADGLAAWRPWSTRRSGRVAGRWTTARSGRT